MDLNSTIDFDIKRFFLWWGRELSLCLPEKIRQKLLDRSGNIYISIKDDVMQLYRLDAGATRLISDIDLNDNSGVRLQQLIEQEPEILNARHILRLQSGQAIYKTISLPVAAKENLQQVINFEMNRFTPFKPEQVYFDYKQLGKEANGQINILLVVTPKELLDAMYQSLKESGVLDIGVFPDVVDYSKAPNNYAEDYNVYNLLPDWVRPEKNKSQRITTWSLTALSVILLIMIFLFPVMHEKQAVETLREQLRSVEKDARLVQAKQQEMDEIVKQTQQLLDIKNSTPSVVELINQLSVLLKDDTWLTHFQLRNGRLQIQGQSASASTLISVLEDSPLFSNARFVSPLTQDKRTGMERFQVSASVTTGETQNAE